MRAFATRIATRVVDEKSPREPGTVRCAVIVQLEMIASVFYTTSANRLNDLKNQRRLAPRRPPPDVFFLTVLVS
jgi:hypothetical protein